MGLSLLERIIGDFAHSGGDEYDINARDNRCPDGGRIKKQNWGHLDVRAANNPSATLGVLSYDFDFIAVSAPMGRLDGSRLFHDPNSDTYYEARWRNPNTVMAITLSNPTVRDLLRDAGFGSEMSGAKLPKGRFDPSHETMRHDVIRRLSQVLHKNADRDIDWGQFDCAAFYADHADALPIGADVSPASFTRASNGRVLLVLAGTLALCFLGYAAVLEFELSVDVGAILMALFVH